MTRDPKLPPDEAWEAVEKTALTEEAGRVAKLSDAALDRELEKKHVDAKALRERGAALAAKLMVQKAGVAAAQPAVAPPQPPARRPTRRTAWLVAAAVGALGAGLCTMNYAAIVAVFKPLPIGPDVAYAQRAAKLRDDALAACHESQWTTCGAKLDEAKALDPAGELDPRVVKARKDVAASQLPEPDRQLKPENLK